MRSLGTTTGSAVVGIVLAQMTVPLHGVPVPSEAGFHTVLAIGAGVALVAAVIVAFIPAARTVVLAESSVDAAAPAPSPAEGRPGEHELVGARER
jgi:hypothetical protein